MFRTQLCFVTSVVLIAFSVSQVKGSDSSLDTTLQAIQAKSVVPGFCVAVVDAGGIRYSRGFGYADIAAKRPYTADTVQPVASVSKMLIATALMQSVERGDLQLDEDVSDAVGFKVRNPRFPNAPITLRQLATHTSSIVDRQPFMKDVYFNGAQQAFDIRSFLHSYLVPGGKNYSIDNFGKDAPGKIVKYSNFGATLIALAIERKAHATYAQYTRTQILRPLHMNQSFWSSNEVHSSLATLYDPHLKPIPPYSYPDYPDGGLFTTCNDLGKFLSAMIRGYKGGNGLLTASSFRTMFSPQLDPKRTTLDEGGYNAGILWQLTPWGSIGHPGNDLGVMTLIAFEPKGGYGRVMLFNISNSLEDPKGTPEERHAIWVALDKFGQALSTETPGQPRN